MFIASTPSIHDKDILIKQIVLASETVYTCSITLIFGIYEVFDSDDVFSITASRWQYNTHTLNK